MFNLQPYFAGFDLLDVLDEVNILYWRLTWQFLILKIYINLLKPSKFSLCLKRLCWKIEIQHFESYLEGNRIEVCPRSEQSVVTVNLRIYFWPLYFQLLWTLKFTFNHFSFNFYLLSPLILYRDEMRVEVAWKWELWESWNCRFQILKSFLHDVACTDFWRL